MTRCAAHAKGSPVAVKPGLENIHIVERIVGDRGRVVTLPLLCPRKRLVRRVDPLSLGIEE
jgi:hypothetical protein